LTQLRPTRGKHILSLNSFHPPTPSPPRPPPPPNNTILILRFAKVDEPPTPEKKADTYTSGFADWQLKSSKFRPPPPKPNHRLYREDVEYETWEEHYDDDGTRFFYNPSTNKSQWDVPDIIVKAMAKEETLKRQKEQDEVDSYYASHGVSSEGSGYYGADGSWVEGGYDGHGNYVEYGGTDYGEVSFDMHYILF